jgi:hypothetical protein
MTKLTKICILCIALILYTIFVVELAEWKIRRDVLRFSGKVVGYPEDVKQIQEMWSQTPSVLYLKPGMYK